MEQTCANVVTKALTDVGLARPKYPYLSAQQSALLHMAMSLKMLNPKNSQCVLAHPFTRLFTRLPGRPTPPALRYLPPAPIPNTTPPHTYANTSMDAFCNKRPIPPQHRYVRDGWRAKLRRFNDRCELLRFLGQHISARHDVGRTEELDKKLKQFIKLHKGIAL